MDDASADDGAPLLWQLQQPVPELGLLQLVQEPDPVPEMGNMAVVAQGLTWLQLRPLLQPPQLPRRYAAALGARQQRSRGADGAEGGGGGAGEEEAGVEGGGDGGGGDLLLLQMHRHCKPPSFLRWLLRHKETFKKMPFDLESKLGQAVIWPFKKK